MDYPVGNTTVARPGLGVMECRNDIDVTRGLSTESEEPNIVLYHTIYFCVCTHYIWSYYIWSYYILHIYIYIYILYVIYQTWKETRPEATFVISFLIVPGRGRGFPLRIHLVSHEERATRPFRSGSYGEVLGELVGLGLGYVRFMVARFFS